MPTEETMNIDERYRYLCRMQKRYVQGGAVSAASC